MTQTHELPTVNVRELLDLLAVGAPISYRGLSVFPLIAKTPIPSATHLVLDDALATGRFRVTEISQAGSVPQLLVINETEKPVFLLDREELVGAKQNRVVNLSLMVAAETQTEIPVSCVEAGRWHATSRTFQTSDRAQFSRARAQKMRQVSQSLHLSEEPISDQGAVWDEIAEKSLRMGVASSTSAMSAIFEDRRKDVREFLDAFHTVGDQIGAAYAIGGSVSGIDVFASTTTFEKLAGKLLASCAIDAIELSDTTMSPAVDDVVRFIGSAKAAPCERFCAPGIGETIRFSDDQHGLIGAALEVDGACVHVAAFRQGDDELGDGLRPARRRRYGDVRGRGFTA